MTNTQTHEVNPNAGPGGDQNAEAPLAGSIQGEKGDTPQADAPRAEAPKGDATNVETRHRLLEAAGEVFAELGFRCATVRDICTKARANVAAVNYHFGDKQGLYTAVLKFAHECSCGKYPPDLGVSERNTPEERLRAYVRAFMLRFFDTGRPAWHGKLEAREMIEPTAALDSLVQEQIRPRAELLQRIVRSILGPGADERLVRNCAGSVVGQCVFYHHSRAVITRLNPEQQYRPEDIDALAEHITRFSLAALNCLAAELRA